MSEGNSSKGIIEKLAPIILILTIALAFSVGFLWLKVTNLEKGILRENASPVPVEEISGKLPKEKAEKVTKVQDSDHIYGNKDAEVAIIVYSDLECPFCKRFHETAKQAVKEYGGKVSMVFRHFPLDLLHSKARPEAEATECVAKLGGEEKFRKYLDKIFEVTPSNNGLDLSLLAKYAAQFGVNQTEFKNCTDKRETKEVIENVAKKGEEAGVTGTPGVFVVNKKGEVWLIPGAVPIDMLKTSIDEALK